MCPIVRRSSSACAAEYPPSFMAIAIACSWKIGMPCVRLRIGSRAGCGYVTGSCPRRRAVYGCTNFAWIGPGRISATCTTMSYSRSGFVCRIEAICARLSI